MDEQSHPGRRLSFWAKVAPWVGLVAAALEIVQSVTGMLEKAVAILAQRLTPATEAPPEPILPPHQTSVLERLAVLGLLGLFTLRVVLVLAIPLLPAGLAWRVAYRRNWENDYRPAPHIGVAAVYLVAVGLAMAFVFPNSPLWNGLQMWLSWAEGRSG